MKVFWQKLGFYPADLVNAWKSKSNWIWFHAVSVGELKAVWPLILKVYKEKTGFPITISCTTKAGYKLACELSREYNFLVFYFPFDFPHVVKTLLNYVKIKLLIIVETEIWPNILKEAAKRQIPILLVNARLSDKSFKNYLFFKFYFKHIVNYFNEILAQSERDADKFIKLGLEKSKIKVLGNIKFASAVNGTDNSRYKSSDKTTIIFASTHRSEEELAITTYKELLKHFSDIRLIIAPRHIDRVLEILDLIKKYNFIPLLKSKDGLTIKSINEVLVIDTIGELQEIFKISDITVIGGTFAKVGGHNILEPISSKSYTIIGPNDYKILELSNVFKKEKALVQVTNTSQLVTKIKEAVLNKTLREETINRGIKIIKENAEVLERTYKHILAYL